MGLNWTGIGAAYEGYQDESRRAAEDERKQQADARLAQDAAFQDQARARQRDEWTKADDRNARKQSFLAQDAANTQKEYEDAWANAGTNADATSDAQGNTPPNAIQSLKASVAANVTDKTAPVKMSFAPDKMPAQAPDSVTNPPEQGNVPPPTPLQKAIKGLAANNPAVPDGNTEGSPTASLKRDSNADANADTNADADANTDTTTSPNTATATSTTTTTSTTASPNPGMDGSKASNQDGNTSGNTDADADADSKANAKTDAKTAAAAVDPATSIGGFSPAVIKEQLKPAGIPKPEKFADALGRQSRLLDYQASQGDIDPATYATQKAMLNKLRAEGVNDALDLMNQGNGEDAIKAFNNVGMYRNTRFISQRTGTTTLPNGQQHPTNIVTLARADGSRVEVDSTLARYQLMSLNEKMNLLDKATQTKMTTEHNAGIVKAAQQQANSLQQARSGVSGNGVNATKSAARNADTVKPSIWDAKALDAEVRNNAHLYQLASVNGAKPLEHVSAKSLYTSLLQNPNISLDNAYGVMANIRRAAERRSIDSNTGAIDPVRFLASYDNMVQDVQSNQKSQQAMLAQLAKPAVSRKQ